MTTLDPTAIANAVAADCLLTIAERAAYERSINSVIGAACVALSEDEALTVLVQRFRPNVYRTIEGPLEREQAVKLIAEYIR